MQMLIYTILLMPYNACCFIVYRDLFLRHMRLAPSAHAAASIIIIKHRPKILVDRNNQILSTFTIFASNNIKRLKLCSEVILAVS